MQRAGMLVLSFLFLLFLSPSLGDHCMGGAAKWWTDENDPDALTVIVVVRQIWRVGSPGEATHSHLSRFLWGDNLFDDYDSPKCDSSLSSPSSP